MTETIKKAFENHVESYTKSIMENNEDNLKQFEVRPGVYSNVDPSALKSVHAADYDINRTPHED